MFHIAWWRMSINVICRSCPWAIYDETKMLDYVRKQTYYVVDIFRMSKLYSINYTGFKQTTLMFNIAML